MAIGLGVVVTQALGFSPRRSASMRLSQVSLGYFHAAISSAQAVSNWGPRSWSGS